MRLSSILGLLCCITLAQAAVKAPPDQIIAQLQAGNARFVAGTSQHPNTDAARLRQAGTENQGDHAVVTVITCSDSRVPVERIFDLGVMDCFVIRVAGNVCDTDEIGSIEYGLAHVNTPVLVVLGHTQCGAVTAVTDAAMGHGHALERNIPPLVDNILPAVQSTRARFPQASRGDLIVHGIEANVWQGMRDLFRESPATRQLVRNGQAKVIGAIYDVGTGRVNWLPQGPVADLLSEAERDPNRATEALAAGGHGAAQPAGAAAHGGTTHDNDVHVAETDEEVPTFTKQVQGAGLTWLWQFFVVIVVIVAGSLLTLISARHHGRFRLQLGAKLSLAFSIMLLLTGILGCTSIRSMNAIGLEIDEIAEDLAPIIRLVSTIESTQLEQSISLERAFRFAEDRSDQGQASFAQSVERFRKLAHEADEAIESSLALLEEIPALDEKDAEVMVAAMTDLATIGIHHDTFERHAEACLALLRRGEMHQAHAMEKTIIEEEKRLNKEIEDFHGELEDRLDAAAHAAEEHEGEAVVFILSVSFLLIAFGLGLAWWFGRSLANRAQRMAGLLNHIAEGDLTKRCPAEANDELTDMAGSINRTVEGLHAIIADIREASVQTAASSEELSASAQAISQGAQSQAGTVEEVNASMQELSATIDEVAGNARNANEQAQQTNGIADESNQTVNRSIQGMELINDSSNRIAKIIGVIRQIANQTNLLALNAAIEAASAGEHGLGFAVVADEVRKLAERAGQAAEEITDLIEESGRRVAEGGELSQAVSEALERIGEGIGRTALDMQQIAAGTDDQANTARQVVDALNTIAAVTEENSSSAEEMAASSEELSAQAQRLQELVERFKLSDRHSGGLGMGPTQRPQIAQQSSGQNQAPAKQLPAPEVPSTGALYHD